MRVLVDTNVLLRAAEPGHIQHVASAEAIDAVRRAGHEVVLVPQVLYEFWSVATRPVESNGLGERRRGGGRISRYEAAVSITTRRAGRVR